MNKVFKVIWNHSTQTWTAVSEISHAHGKKSASDKRKAVAAVVAVAGALMASSAAQAGAELGGGSATGTNAVAVGAASKATGTASFAGGTSANAAGVSSVAVGGSMTAAEAAQAVGNNSIAVGFKSSASQTADIAVGYNAKANGTSTGSDGDGVVNNAGSAMAIGTDSQATGIVATAIGQRSQALANGAVALGGDAQAKQGSDVAIGRGSVADGISASAFGPAAQATGKYAVALGVQSQATSEQAIALGRLSQANGKFATALGNGAQATAQNTLALGTEAKSTIENSVALGNGSTTSAFVPTNTATVGSYTYSGFAGATSGLGNGAVLSVGSAGNERQIQNVAAGRINATSTDAINGSQLFAVANRIENLNPFVFSGHNGSGSSPAEGTFKYNPNSANNPLKLIAGEGLKMTSNGTNEYTLSVIGGGATGATGAKGDKGDPGKDGKDADGTFGLVDETGTTDGSISKKLNNTIQIKGDAGTKVQVFDKATGKTSEKEVQNIFVKKDGDALKASLNPDLTVNSVTTNELKAGPVTINKDGIDAGNTTIKNVAPGKNGTDAVNVDQLNQKFGDVNSSVNKVDNNARAGVAQALATAGLPQAYLPGKSMLAIGGSHYRGETGYAVGLSSISDGGHWIIKGTASGNSRGHFGATVAVGYQW